MPFAAMSVGWEAAIASVTWTLRPKKALNRLSDGRASLRPYQGG
jgi:hypothetical protein